MIDDETLEKYREAGTIAAKVISEGKKGIRVGASYLEVVELIEGRVAEEGAGLAFPLNLSLNEDAAHDTASAGDARLFTRGDVAKLDLGVHIDGYIADTATTVDLGTNPSLVEASYQALEHAIGKVRPGVTAGELGAAIQYEIEIRGFRPVANLTGHGLDQYIIHKPPTIPNIGTAGGTVLEEGMVFAIEPFASTGSGRVKEKTRKEIYQQISNKPVRIPSGRAVMECITDRRGLPFARRWLPNKKSDIALPGLVRTHNLHVYPVLADTAGSLVSQHEHTLVVTDTGCIVTTR
ncbi:MAG: type II methionyl aminopeptidase [Methanoregula sp.]|jgi:methionyl aminopeptidase|nr:type II methionyl aminopeptidase [Methanoregula sp.]